MNDVDSEFFDLLKLRRAVLGMSQAELARSSGVSLPMIQLIEADRSKPTVPVFQKILRALGLEIVLRPSFSWNELIAHGGPLFSNAKPARPIGARDSQTFRKVLIESCLKLEQDRKDGLLDARKKEAVEAMLLAYRLYYPLRYASLERKSPLIRKFGAFRINGRHIKLKRIALEYMKEYL